MKLKALSYRNSRKRCRITNVHRFFLISLFLRFQPSPELIICRHKKSSLTGQIILITKYFTLCMCFTKSHCLFLSGESSPNPLPVKACKIRFSAVEIRNYNFQYQGNHFLSLVRHATPNTTQGTALHALSYFKPYHPKENNF